MSCDLAFTFLGPRSPRRDGAGVCFRVLPRIHVKCLIYSVDRFVFCHPCASWNIPLPAWSCLDGSSYPVMHLHAEVVLVLLLGSLVAVASVVAAEQQQQAESAPLLLERTNEKNCACGQFLRRPMIPRTSS